MNALCDREATRRRRRRPGVGGGAHNGSMQIHEECERCEGTGADPMQHFDSDEVRLCAECFGDGFVEVFEFRMPERLSA